MTDSKNRTCSVCGNPEFPHNFRHRFKPLAFSEKTSLFESLNNSWSEQQKGEDNAYLERVTSLMREDASSGTYSVHNVPSRMIDVIKDHFASQGFKVSPPVDGDCTVVISWNF